MPKVVLDEPEPVVKDGHFEASVPWHQLSSDQKNHMLNCPTCAYPYYNNLPEEECLLTIHSHLLEKECKVSPYQYLHITSENFRLGVRSDASKNNLYYLNHVEKQRRSLKDNGERFMDFVNCEVELSRMNKGNEDL